MTAHKTEKLLNPFDGRTVAIDEKLAPLIRLMWKSGIETVECCEEEYPGLAMISFLETFGVETFFYVAKRNYFVQARGFYDEDEEGNCSCCQVFLDVHFPAEEIPRLVKGFKTYESEERSLRRQAFGESETQAAQRKPKARKARKARKPRGG
jgi:hypothetical protein